MRSADGDADGDVDVDGDGDVDGDAAAEAAVGSSADAICWATPSPPADITPWLSAVGSSWA